jgi:hypothetical protein
MKKQLFSLIIGLCTIQNTFAFIASDSTERLNIHKTSSTIKEATDEVNAILATNDRSNTNAQGEKRYYDTFKIFLNVDDELTLLHQSKNFRVMLSFISPEKKTDFSYDSQEFEGKSSNTYFYKAKTAGIYTLFASSADPNKLGAFSIKKTIQKAQKENSNDPFAVSVKQLLDLRKNKYQGEMGNKISEHEGKYVFESKYSFVQGKKGEIIFEDGGKVYTYQSNIYESDNQVDAQKYYNELAQKLNNYAKVKDWFSEPLTPETKSMYISSETDMITLKLNKKDGKYQVLFICN